MATSSYCLTPKILEHGGQVSRESLRKVVAKSGAAVSSLTETKPVLFYLLEEQPMRDCFRSEFVSDGSVPEKAQV